MKWNPVIWKLLTVTSILSLALSSSAALSRFKEVEELQSEPVVNMRRHWRWGLFLFALVISLVLLAVVENIVDRHWMVLFVPAVIWVATSDVFLIVKRPGRFTTAVMWFVGISIAYISVTFTHDWLAFNDQRAQQMSV